MTPTPSALEEGPDSLRVSRSPPGRRSPQPFMGSRSPQGSRSLQGVPRPPGPPFPSGPPRSHLPPSAPLTDPPPSAPHRPGHGLAQRASHWLAAPGGGTSAPPGQWEPGKGGEEGGDEWAEPGRERAGPRLKGPRPRSGRGGTEPGALAGGPGHT